MSSRERHDKPLKRLGSYLRSRVPRRLATDAESAKSPPRREDGAEASGQVADPPRIPGSDLPYRATNGTCKVEEHFRVLTPSARRTAGRRDLLQPARGRGGDRKLAPAPQQRAPARLARLPAASTGGG